MVFSHIGAPRVAGKPFTVEVRNRIDAIAPASAAVEAWLEQHGASADALHLAILAIEEMVSNCIKYGYDDAGEHTIIIGLSIDGQKMNMVFCDDGHAFNPLAVPPPDLSLGIEERKIGGLGIYMVRHFADEARYERDGEFNRLTLTKQMP